MIRAPLAAALAATVLSSFAAVNPAEGQIPDHPVITEVFTDPPGASDGPVGRAPSNLHQEYIEIYLPPAGDLDPGLNKDNLRLTLYEVEGDSSSGGLGLVNYRIDLPAFDLDSSNGQTPGTILRPASGIVVLGWVDYTVVAGVPTDLFGTPSTRLALINGGVTSTSGFLFVAINGGQFSGTTNFPVPDAISSIDMPAEASSGIIQNGSGAYLLVDRDSFGYVELYDDANIPVGGSANPSLPSGGVLGTAALLDGFAGNDDSTFDVFEQPYSTPTGDDIDLETVLPLGGAFSMLVPQIAEAGNNGYARRFVDIVKTTDDALPANDDPVADALSVYHPVANVGPFFPTPGSVSLTTSPPELAVPDVAPLIDGALAGTIVDMGVLCANVGGNFGIQIAAAPGGSSNPAAATFAPGTPATVMTGQTLAFPGVATSIPLSAVDGAVATTSVTLTATNVNGGDPAVINPVATTSMTMNVFKPTTGQNADGAAFQGTVLAALYGLPDEPGVPNEFVGTSLAQFVADNLGGLVDDERHNGLLLLDPATNLSDPFLVDVMEDDMPDEPAFFVNFPSAAGLDDLVTTILNSADQTENGTYDDNFNEFFTAVRAIDLNIGETFTSGGTFVPDEQLYFADAAGRVGAPGSPLSNVQTTRGFEFALLDTNVQENGMLETGESDDFGIIVEVGQVGPGASVVPGEFVFLSFTGGLEGADIDSLNVPPGANQTVIIYLDLDNLDTQMGCKTITQMYIIDGSGGNAINVIEAFSLNAVVPVPLCACRGDVDQDGLVTGLDIAVFVDQVLNPGDPAVSPEACAADVSQDGIVNVNDIPLMVNALLTGACAP